MLAEPAPGSAFVPVVLVAGSAVVVLEVERVLDWIGLQMRKSLVVAVSSAPARQSLVVPVALLAMPEAPEVDLGFEDLLVDLVCLAKDVDCDYCSDWQSAAFGYVAASLLVVPVAVLAAAAPRLVAGLVAGLVVRHALLAFALEAVAVD